MAALLLFLSPGHGDAQAACCSSGGLVWLLDLLCCAISISINITQLNKDTLMYGQPTASLWSWHKSCVITHRLYPQLW